MSRKEKQERNYENVNKGCFPTAGEYNIPILAPVEYRQCDWVGFNYQFTRLWGSIDYIA